MEGEDSNWPIYWLFLNLSDFQAFANKRYLLRPHQIKREKRKLNKIVVDAVLASLLRNCRKNMCVPYYHSSHSMRITSLAVDKTHYCRHMWCSSLRADHSNHQTNLKTRSLKVCSAVSSMSSTQISYIGNLLVNLICEVSRWKHVLNIQGLVLHSSSCITLRWWAPTTNLTCTECCVDIFIYNCDHISPQLPVPFSSKKFYHFITPHCPHSAIHSHTLVK